MHNLKEMLGDDWLTPELFRFGASTLLNDVLMQIVKSVDAEIIRPPITSRYRRSGVAATT